MRPNPLPALVSSLLFVGLAGLAALACGTGIEEEPDWEGSAAQSEDEVAVTLRDENAPLLVKDPRTLTTLEPCVGRSRSRERRWSVAWALTRARLERSLIGRSL